MGKGSKGAVILRQWQMLHLVPASDQHGISVEELTAALDVRSFAINPRSVERDLEALQEILPLEIVPGSRPKRWRWRKKGGVDVPGMEAAEAMALNLTHDLLAHYMPSAFMEALKTRIAQADRTLNTITRTGSRKRWIDKVRVLPSHVVLQPPNIQKNVLQTIQRALLQEMAIEVLYKGHKDAKHKSRLLYPRGMILRGSSIYLVAHEKNCADAPRHFALQRIASVELKVLEPWPNVTFSLDEFLCDGGKQFGDGAEIALTATVSEELYRILLDTPLTKDMRLTKPLEGRAKLTARVRDTWALHTWILSHAQHIQIRQPAKLRRLIRKCLAEAAAQYE